MKMPLAALLLLVILDAAWAQVPSQKSDEKQVRQTVQRFYDTFNSHDWGKLAEFTTEDFAWAPSAFTRASASGR